MIIEAKVFRKFIELTSLSGTIGTAVYKVTPESMTARCTMGDVSSVSFVSSVQMDGGEYTGVTEDTLIPIKNNKMLIDVLKDMEGKISVNISENYLIIESETSKAELIISHPDYIRNTVQRDPNVSFDKLVDVNVSSMKKIYKHMKNMDSVFVWMKVENGMLSMMTGDENLDKITEKIPVDLPNCMSKFNKVFGIAIDKLDGVVRIGLSDNYPMLISYIDESGIESTYYIINCD